MTDNYFREMYIKIDRLDSITSDLYMSEKDKENISGDRMNMYRETKKELEAVRNILKNSL